MDALRFLTLDSLCEVLDLRFLDLPFKTKFFTKTAFDTSKKSFAAFSSVFVDVPYFHSRNSLRFCLQLDTQNCQHIKTRYNLTKSLQWVAPTYVFLTKPTAAIEADVVVNEILHQTITKPVWIPTKQQTLVGSLNNCVQRYVENINVYAPLFLALSFLLLALFQIFKNPAAPSTLFNTKHGSQDVRRELGQNLLLKLFKQLKLWTWLRKFLSKYIRR